MNNKLTVMGACIVLLALSASVQSAEDTKPTATDAKLDRRVQVEWINPKTFTDMRDRNFSSDRFRERAFTVFEEHLSELAKDLPEGQSLKFKVTDVDLAGRVEPGYFSGLVDTTDNIRIMRDIDIPRMKFEYALIDAKGKVLKQEEVTLKDMNYLGRIRSASSNRPFSYEKRMLTRWFEQNFKNS